MLKTLGKRAPWKKVFSIVMALLFIFSISVALNLSLFAANATADDVLTEDFAETDDSNVTETEIAELEDEEEDDVINDIDDDFDYEGNGFIEGVGGMFGKLAEPFDLSLKGINLYAATSATGIEIEEPVWGDTITLFAATQKDLQDAVNGAGDYFGFTSNSKTIIIPGDITFTSSSTITIPAGMEIKLMSDDSLRTIDAGKLCRGVTVNDGGKLWLENIKITNSNSSGGMYYTGGGTLCMTNSYINGNAGDGVSMTGEFSLVMDNSEISHNAGYGIYAYAYNCSGIMISMTDSKICDNSNYGLYAYTNNVAVPISITLLRSSVSENKSYGMYLQQCFGGTLSMTDSFILDNKGYAIQSYVTDSNPVNRFTIYMDNTHIGNENSELTNSGLHLNCTDVEMRSGSSITGIRGNNAGGGVYLSSSTLTMYDSEISDNKTTSTGAGVYMNTNSSGIASKLIMYNSEMSDNECLPVGSGGRGQGGAVNMGNFAEVYIYNSKMLRNISGQGGAINIDAGNAKLIVEDSELSYNKVLPSTGGSNSLGGGAIYNNSSGIINVAGTTFSFNEAIQTGGGGGAISNRDSSASFLTLTNCTFTDNKITTDNYGGGAVFNRGGTSLSPNTITNCTFERNTVETTNYGGGAIASEGYLNISNCNIQDNNTSRGGYGGGGLFVYGTINMTGGKITDSKSFPAESTSYGGCGGGVSVCYGTFTIEGVEISGNEAQGSGNYNKGDGGGIFVPSWGGRVVIKSGCSIQNNIAGRDGGGIFSGGNYSNIVIEEGAGFIFSGNKAGRVFIPQDETGLNTGILTPGKITSVSVDPNLLKLLGKPNNGLYPYTNYDINVTGDSALQYIDDGDVHGTGTYPIALAIADEEQHGVLGYNGSAPDEYFLSCWEVVNGSGTVVRGGGASSSRSGSIMAALGTLIPSPAGGGEAIAAPVMITSGPIGIGDFVAIGAKIIPDPASTPGDILILNAVWEELPKANLTYSLNTTDTSAKFNSSINTHIASTDFTRTYEVGVGEAISAHSSYKANINLNKPTRDDYRFVGWFMDQEGQTAITKQTMGASSMILYAKWVSDEKIDISIEKKWEHGDNAPANHPKEITVYIKGNDVTLEKKINGDDDHWKKIESMPKYDNEGNLHVYTINEKDVVRYTKRISGDMENGFVITNTYNPTPGGNGGSNGGATGRNTPNTGDFNLIWISLLCGMVLASGLIMLIFTHDKKTVTKKR